MLLSTVYPIMTLIAGLFMPVCAERAGTASTSMDAGKKRVLACILNGTHTV